MLACQQVSKSLGSVATAAIRQGWGCLSVASRPLGVQMEQRRTEYTRPGYGSRYGFTNWQMKKDFHRRECVKEHFATRMRLNALRKNTILPTELQEEAHKEVIALPRDSNPIRLVDRCVLTSRPRGVKTRYRVSRIMYRHFVDYNQMSGVTRASW